MSDSEDEDEAQYNVGRGNPPLHTRFRKGISGNRRGRPKGSRKQIPYDSVLSRKVSLHDAGGERQVEAAEAFLLYLRKRWADGDPTARRLLTKAIEASKQLRSHIHESQIDRIIIKPVAPGSPNGAFLALKMGVKHDAFRTTARILIEPWLVQASLDRLGDRRLTHNEQETVVKATRTPSKVKWPDWWEVKPQAAR